MNSSEEGSVEEMHLELKYCERCGGLWLRPAGGGQVYCARCAPEMEELPVPSRRRPQMPRGPQWSRRGNAPGRQTYNAGDLEAAGGVA